ncbi:MAG: OsmC family protein [Chloroflexi bacterium]|nr:OsmC family protein [Chloroflexota bacterium]
MMATITVNVKQVNDATSEGTARDHKVLIDRPAAKNGYDAGAMGGELLLMALGGCFMSNLLAAIRARDEVNISAISVDVVGTKEDTPDHFSAVELQISAAYDDPAQMEKLVTIAERGCLVANTLRNAVSLSFTIRPAVGTPHA